MSEELIIEPRRGFKGYWRDIWRYRELFYILAWRDLRVRYKQTVIGVAWALIRPLATMIVFTVVFNKVAKLEAPGALPYPLLVFAGMLSWQYFSTALSESSNSVIHNANLISKVYFPRLIIPAGSVITSSVDILITLGLMALMMMWFGFLPGVDAARNSVWSQPIAAPGRESCKPCLRIARLAFGNTPVFMVLAFGTAFVTQAVDQLPQSNVNPTVSSFKLTASSKKPAPVCVSESLSSQKMGRYFSGLTITTNLSGCGLGWVSASVQ